MDACRVVEQHLPSHSSTVAKLVIAYAEYSFFDFDQRPKSRLRDVRMIPSWDTFCELGSAKTAKITWFACEKRAPFDYSLSVFYDGPTGDTEDCILITSTDVHAVDVFLQAAMPEFWRKNRIPKDWEKSTTALIKKKTPRYRRPQPGRGSF